MLVRIADVCGIVTVCGIADFCRIADVCSIAVMGNMGGFTEQTTSSKDANNDCRRKYPKQLFFQNYLFGIINDGGLDRTVCFVQIICLMT